MRSENEVALELDDIQSGVLRPRPSPYSATYIILRIDDQNAGRELMRRLSTVVSSAAHRQSPIGDTWLSATLTYAGLERLGVPKASLESFAWEFRQGMAKRARALGDIGESSPENWEKPLGTSDVHVVLVAIAPDDRRLELALEGARKSLESLPGVVAIWRQNCHAPAHQREHFGFRDSIGYPDIEGSGITVHNPYEPPLKAGEFVLGYPDETGGFPPMPQPEELGRNGTYVVFRKLHQCVALFRQFLQENSKSVEEQEWLAAKMMGRWRSGAPLALCPFHDDQELGADPKRNNDFLFKGDSTGYATPIGSHVRRANPRDASVAGVARLHRMLRRGTAYGPPLPEGVMEDDGVERGLMFAFIGSHLGRQFEFVQSEWINSGEFVGLGEAKDPIAATFEKTGTYSIPRRPMPKRLRGLSQFVATRGGEYCFMPGLSALRWLSELK